MSDKGIPAIVEIMGHVKRAGFVTKDETFGAPMLRITIPATSEQPEFDEYYGLNSLYAIKPVGEQAVLLAAENFKARPIVVWNPELITRDEHERTIEKLMAQINAFRNGLPAGKDETYDKREEQGEPEQDEDEHDDKWYGDVGHTTY